MRQGAVPRFLRGSTKVHRHKNTLLRRLRGSTGGHQHVYNPNFRSMYVGQARLPRAGPGEVVIGAYVCAKRATLEGIPI